MDTESSRQLLNGLTPPSLAQLYRDFGERWEIEPVPPGAKWMAFERESGGDYVRIIAAHDVHALRLRLRLLHWAWFGLRGLIIRHP